MLAIEPLDEILDVNLKKPRDRFFDPYGKAIVFKVNDPSSFRTRIAAEV